MLLSTGYAMTSSDPSNRLSSQDVDLGLEQLQLLHLYRTDPEAFEEELLRMYPGSKRRDQKKDRPAQP
jgi:hypothetical protein